MTAAAPLSSTLQALAELREAYPLTARFARASALVDACPAAERAAALERAASLFEGTDPRACGAEWPFVEALERGAAPPSAPLCRALELRNDQRRGHELDAARLAALAARPELSGVRRLVLSGFPLGAAGVTAALGGAGLAALEDLELLFLDLTTADYAAIVAHPGFARIRRLQLWQHAPADGGVFATGRATPQLRQLTLNAHMVRDEALVAILTSPHLPALESLYVGSSGPDDAPPAGAGVALPAGATPLPALRSLTFERAAERLRALAALPPLPALRELVVLSPLYWLPPADVQALAAWPGLAGVRRLKFTNLGPEGALALATSPYLTALEELDLSGCSVDDAAALALAAAPALGRLVTLDLGHNNLTGQAASALLRAPTLAALRDLNLARNNIHGDELAAAPGPAGLTRLSLARNPLGRKAGAALAASPRLAALESLTLYGTGFGDEGLAALAASPHLGRLARLDLDEAGIGAAGCEALAASPLLGQLVELGLHETFVGDAGAKALAASGRVARLERLGLFKAGVRRGGAQALVDAPETTAALRESLLREFKVTPGGGHAPKKPRRPAPGAAVAALTRPAAHWTLRPAAAETLPLTGSHVGGLPYLEGKDRWPRCPGCGAPLQFLFQADFANDAPGLGPFALLTFFYCGDCMPWQGVSDDAQGFAVRTYLTPDVARAKPAKPPRELEGEVVPHAVTASLGTAFPDAAALPTYLVGALAGFAGDEAALLEEAARTLPAAPGGAAPATLGGYPVWIQAPDVPVCERCETPMALLVQLPDERGTLGLPCGDGGTLYLFACAKHPKRIVLRVQSG